MDRHTMKNSYKHIYKRKALAELIKQVGIAWGEPIDNLREYAREQLDDLHTEEDLDKSLNCFTDLLKQAKISTEKFRGVRDVK